MVIVITQLMQLDELLHAFTAIHRHLGVLELRTFLFVAKAYHEGEPLTTAYLSTVLQLPHKIMQPVVQSLEDACLITKRRDPDDRRAKLLELTAKGTALLTRLKGRGTNHERQTAA